jgi:hypothetical protein
MLPFYPEACFGRQNGREHMKKHIRIAAAVLTGALLTIIGPLSAFAAAEANFDREAGAGNEWSYLGVTSYGDPADLFGAVTKELVPGDTKTFNVQLRNSSDAATTFWLKAEALTLDGAKALEDDFAGKTAIDALLGHIGIDVSCGTTSVYTGTLGGVGSGDLYLNGAELGTLAANSYEDVNVTLTVSDTLDNRYTNSLCAVNWTFTATQEDPVGGGGGGGGGTPLEELEDEDVPLAEALPEDTDIVVIADPETPLALPQTGGLMTYATPAAIALAVLLLLYAATYIGSRRNIRKEAV